MNALATVLEKTGIVFAGIFGSAVALLFIAAVLFSLKILFVKLAHLLEIAGPVGWMIAGLVAVGLLSWMCFGLARVIRRRG